MKGLVFGFAALATTAQAAPAVAQAWSGGYAGVRVGYGYQRDDSNETILFDRDLNGTFGDTVTTASGADAFARGFCGGAVNANETECDDENSANFALFAGYDFALSANVVVGAVVEYGRSSIEDSVTAFSSDPASFTLTRELKEFASLRLRAGYALRSNTLIYATGGVAGADVDYRFETTNTENTFEQRGGRGTSYGYQVGGGVEQRITPRLAVGAQYLFLNLEGEEFRVRAGGSDVPVSNPFILGNPNGTDFRRESERFKSHDVSITASYRF
jgi:outer membrane immunogenic protein